MLSNLHYEHVKITSGGSVYPVSVGKHTVGFAFYYQEENGDKKRKVVTGCNEDELKEKAVKFLGSIEANHKLIAEKTKVVFEEMSKPTRLTFRDVGLMWFNEYSQLLNKKRNGISYSTLESRDLAFRTMLPYLGDFYIDSITQDTADKLIDICSEKEDGSLYSFSYVDKIQQTFHMIMKYAREHDFYHQKLETTALDFLEKANSDARFLDREQVAEVLRLVQGNERYKMLIELIMASGLRQEEAFALSINDFIPVNATDVEVYINKSVKEITKNDYRIINMLKSSKSRRVVTIPRTVYDKVVKYYNDIVNNETPHEKKLREENGTVGNIFANKNKKVTNKRTFERSFANYIKRQLKRENRELGYDVTLHMLRHSYASLMAETQPVEVVARLLGDTIDTTEKNYYSMSKKVKTNVSASSAAIIQSIQNFI